MLVSQSFEEWCAAFAARDPSDAKNRDCLELIYWARGALQDLNTPWGGTCQNFYDYMRQMAATNRSIENFYSMWELSGRVVEVDCDNDESDTLSYESASLASSADSLW
jgi:hypothetical protein